MKFRKNKKQDTTAVADGGDGDIQTIKEKKSSSKKRWGLRWKPSFTRLLENDDFNQIRDILMSCDSDEIARKWLEEGGQNDFIDETPLHLVLKYHPPLDIVESITEILTCTKGLVAEQQQDGTGQTPLHTAAEWGAGSLIVGRFLKNASSSTSKNSSGLSVLSYVKMKDNKGRTPLHLVLMNPKGLAPQDVEWCDSGQFSADFKEEQEQDMIEVVKILCRIDPDGLRVRDIRGKTPLHYSKSRGASAEMLQVLENVKKQKKHHSSKGSSDPNKKTTSSRRKKYQEKNEQIEADELLAQKLAGMFGGVNKLLDSPTNDIKKMTTKTSSNNNPAVPSTLLEKPSVTKASSKASTPAKTTHVAPVLEIQFDAATCDGTSRVEDDYVSDLDSP
mmetsp:Transcript_5618/g.8642  ORF Transcript_5618/g.8642 Transcript_5618/m.8642 type:complete len:389 (+) Transcript_5618:236-1402(+)